MVFRRYLIQHAYPLAIDGSQKLARDTLWDENLLERTLGQDEARPRQYFVYFLDASLARRNGLVIGLAQRLLEFAQVAAECPEAGRRTTCLHTLERTVQGAVSTPADPAVA